MKTYIKIKTAFLLTEQGAPIIPILKLYKVWDTGKAGDDKIKERQTALIDTGLVVEGAKKIEDLESHIKEVFEESDGLTLKEITDAIVEAGKVTPNQAQVRASLNFHCRQDKEKKDGTTKRAWLRRVGPKNDPKATYHKIEATAAAGKNAKGKNNK